jgi:hypothetical protein
MLFRSLSNGIIIIEILEDQSVDACIFENRSLIRLPNKCRDGIPLLSVPLDQFCEDGAATAKSQLGS